MITIIFWSYFLKPSFFKYYVITFTILPFSKEFGCLPPTQTISATQKVSEFYKTLKTDIFRVSLPGVVRLYFHYRNLCGHSFPEHFPVIFLKIAIFESKSSILVIRTSPGVFVECYDFFQNGFSLEHHWTSALYHLSTMLISYKCKNLSPHHYLIDFKVI